MPTNRNAGTGFLCEPSIGSANTNTKEKTLSRRPIPIEDTKLLINQEQSGVRSPPEISR
jgi:hypothetical protein